MTSQDPRDPPRTSTDLGSLGRGLAALVIAVTIVAIITLVYALNRGPLDIR
jgi:hypothetical protein